jgi:membrane protein YdbS with pleckstrin-like domain
VVSLPLLGLFLGPGFDPPEDQPELPVPESSPRPPLRPPENRVDPGALRWWTLAATLPVLAVIAGQLVALASTGERWLIATVAVSIVVGAAYIWIMPRWRYRVHRWEVDDHAVYTLAGWLRLEWRIAPISRIQTIDTARSPLQRLLGLSSVTVTTASAAGPLKIEGLAADVAAELVHQLTEITHREQGDAT